LAIDTDVTTDLLNAVCPVMLMVTGGLDKLITPSQVLPLSEARPDLAVVEIANAAHFVPLQSLRHVTQRRGRTR
jgi:hypothetical protein